MEDNIEQYTIIKHLLQPIVENAIHHGIRPTKHGGHMQISVCSEEDQICIRVANNGVGISSENAVRLLKEPAASVKKGGYGIYNVQQRVHVYYGEEYGLSIESIIGEALLLP